RARANPARQYTSSGAPPGRLHKGALEPLDQRETNLENGRQLREVGFCWRIHSVMYRVPLVFTPQPEGGYTVTSPALPELLTEGDTLEEAQANVDDAFAAVVELYAEQGRALPASIGLPASGEVVWSEVLMGSP